MKISLHSVSYSGLFYRGKSLSLEEILRRASSFGYDGVELMARRPHAYPSDLDREDRRRLRELADSCGIKLANLAAYNDFSGQDSFKRELNLLYIHEVLNLARDLEIPTVRVFAAGMGEVDPSLSYWRQWELSREGLAEAAKWAQDLGVTLALQNHPPIVESFNDTIEMIEEVGNSFLKASIDPELLVWTGDLDPNSARLRDQLLKIYEACKSHLVFVHIGEIQLRTGKMLWLPGGGGSKLRAERIERTLLGEGVFGKIAEPFIQTLKRINYDGFLSYEVCSPRYVKHTLVDFETVDAEIKRAVNYLKDLLSKS